MSKWNLVPQFRIHIVSDSANITEVVLQFNFTSIIAKCKVSNPLVILKRIFIIHIVFDNLALVPLKLSALLIKHVYTTFSAFVKIVKKYKKVTNCAFTLSTTNDGGFAMLA